ncbi:hypothetical protein GBA52_004578 [Prunus armeniaca]|nr:hypothetical protein GBA52_004578 [Prunus armeniaca]
MKPPLMSSLSHRLVVFWRRCHLVVQKGNKKKKKNGNENSTMKKSHLPFLFSSHVVHMTKTHGKCNDGPIHRIIKSWWTI